MPYIKFSKRYLETLRKYLIVLSQNPTKEALFFKGNDRVYVSKYNESNNLWVNFSAPKEDVEFDLDELAVCNMDEMLNYLKAVQYAEPDTGATISYKTVSGTNSSLELLILEIKGKMGKFYLPMANPGIFIQKYDRKIPVEREKDPTQLRAKFTLSKEDVSTLVNNIGTLGTAMSFGIGVDNDTITLYAKGNSNQQFEIELDSTNVKVLGDYTTTDAKENGGCKIFPMEFLNALVTFGTGFDIELRTFNAPNGKVTTTLKAFGKIDNSTFTRKLKKGEKEEIQAENVPDIDLLIGVTENVAVSVMGLFDIMKSKTLAAA